MEALAAVGLASAIVQFVDFAAKVTLETYEWVDSASDALPHHERFQTLIKQNDDLLDRARAKLAQQRHLSEDERAVQNASELCAVRIGRLLFELAKLEIKRLPGGTRPIGKALIASVKSQFRQGKIAQLQQELRDAQQQLSLAFLLLTRFSRKPSSGDSTVTDMVPRNEQCQGFDRVYECLDQHAIKDTKALLAARKDIIAAIRHQQAINASNHTSGRARNDAAFAALLAAVGDSDDQHAADHLEAMQELAALNASQNQMLSKTEEAERQRKANVRQEQAEAVLESLSYESMSQRSEDIDVDSIANGAFEWIFSDTGSPFRKWLESGEGIFWVSGKAGSGKSTLMKFLCGHGKTCDMLQQWAGSAKLLTAKHFFWYAGTSLQKSHTGLLRSLLHDLLDSDIDTIETICPERWSRATKGASWSRKELVQALQRLELLTDHKVCLFIDGLDEYAPHEDHGVLLRELDGLAKLSNVKICVSSRPWQIFKSRLTNEPRMFVLEDLTKSDMTSYLWERLEESEASGGVYDTFTAKSAEATTFVSEVVKRAEGVFLWLWLISRSFVERLTACGNLSHLRKCLDEFPEDLEDYFRDRIYKRIAGTWRDGCETAKALKLATSMRAAGHFSSFIDFWLLNHEGALDNDQAAIKFQHYEKNEVELEQMLGITRKLLDACCRDLLHVPKISAGEVDPDMNPSRWSAQSTIKKYRVEFLHRTVFDFLTGTDMQELLDKRLPPGFDTPSLASRVIVARLKVIPSDVEFWEDHHLDLTEALPSSPEPALAAELDRTLAHHVRFFSKMYSPDWTGFRNRRLARVQELIALFENCALSAYSTAVNETGRIDWQKPVEAARYDTPEDNTDERTIKSDSLWLSSRHFLGQAMSGWEPIESDERVRSRPTAKARRLSL